MKINIEIYRKMRRVWNISILIILLFLMHYPLEALMIGSKDTSNSVILKNRDDITPLDILRGDTLRVNPDDYVPYDPMPGAVGYRTSEQQDSNYARALRLSIPLSARLANDLRLFSPLLPAKSDFTSKTDRINDALNLPPEYYLPLDVDIANYQYGLLMSQNNVTGINTMQPFGLKIGLSDIGKLLGLVEDVSPVIKYELDFTTDVEIVIYSVNATVAATIFDGRQRPGQYKYTWNGRDDMGRRLPPGDYIAEVRIGKERFFRKRIVLQ